MQTEQPRLIGLRCSPMKLCSRIFIEKPDLLQDNANHFSPVFNLRCEQLGMDGRGRRVNVSAAYEPAQKPHFAR